MSLAFEGIDDNEFGGEDVRNIFNRDGFIFLPFDEEDKKTVMDADAFLAQIFQEFNQPSIPTESSSESTSKIIALGIPF